MRIATDKVAHFALSAFLTLALGRWLHPAISAGAALLVGAAKELWDIPRTGFDWKDLLADLAGVLAGALVLVS